MSNNICFNDNSFIVSYIQSFLRENYSNSILPTNVYDLQTHEALIDYLQQPNIKEMNEAEIKYTETFPELKTMFTISLGADSITFTSKKINKNTSDYLSNNFELFKEVSYNLGWEIESYNDYVNSIYDINNDNSVDDTDRLLLQRYLETGKGLSDELLEKCDFNNDGKVNYDDYNLLVEYITNEKLYITFKRQDKINYFPNQDMLKFINLFTNDYYFYKSINDENQQEIIHDNLTGEYKVCIIKCKPGTTYTIAHSSALSQRLVIGSMVTNKRNIGALKLRNVIDTVVNPGNAITYTTSSESDSKSSRDAQYIAIQCSSNIEDYASLQEVVIPLKLGDINQDGNIDNIDRKLLADYLYYPEGDSRRPTLTKKQLAACDINNDGKITNTDLEWLVEYLEGDRVSLGTIEYKYYIPKEINELNNVASLLVVEGNLIEEYTSEVKDCEVNIFHEEQRTNLYTSSESFLDVENIEVDIDYTDPSTGYDVIEHTFDFLEIKGNTNIEYFDSTETISPSTPSEVSNLLDLSISVNNSTPKEMDLLSTKLCKVNEVYDRIYQQQNKHYYNKKIDEVFSNKLSWTRQVTQNGYSYLRSNMTEFKPVSSESLEANIFSNKFKVVPVQDILDEVFTNDYEIAVDTYGRLVLYSRDINNSFEADMMSWLSNNKFYVLGELNTETINEVGLEVPNLLLHTGKNKIQLSSQTCLPLEVTIKADVTGIVKSYTEQNITSFPVTQSPIGINFESFTKDPWIVHHKFISYLLGQAVTPYSRSEEITYVQNLVTDIYLDYKNTFIPGIYSEELRKLVERFQREYYYYNKGDLNIDNKVNLVDIKLLDDYLRGEGELSENQIKLADTNSDEKLDIEDLNIMYKSFRGINDYLKRFEIEFMFGYLDPATEYRMQKVISQRLYKTKHMVGWNDSRCH